MNLQLWATEQKKEMRFIWDHIIHLKLLNYDKVKDLLKNKTEIEMRIKQESRQLSKLRPQVKAER